MKVRQEIIAHADYKNIIRSFRCSQFDG